MAVTIQFKNGATATLHEGTEETEYSTYWTCDDARWLGWLVRADELGFNRINTFHHDKMWVVANKYAKLLGAEIIHYDPPDEEFIY